jgi:hypothetical protein
VLTCLLAARLGAAAAAAATNTAPAGEEAHWAVREQAAAAAAELCRACPDAAPRLQRQLVSALTQHAAALSTMYGAVVGIEALGPRGVKALLLPNLVPCMAALRLALDGGGGPARQAQAARVRAALLIAAGRCVYRSDACAAWRGAEGGEGRAKRARQAGGQPRLAKATPAQAVALQQQRNPTTDVEKGKPKGTAKGRRAGGRGRAGAPAARASPLAPAALQDFFGEKAEQEVRDAEAEAAAAAGGSTLGANMRPAGDGHGHEPAAAVAGVEGEVPPTNELVEAWRDDFPAAVLRRVMAQLFGGDVEPYAGAVGAAVTDFT